MVFSMLESTRLNWFTCVIQVPDTMNLCATEKHMYGVSAFSPLSIKLVQYLIERNHGVGWSGKSHIP